jgi:Family of unknown function (DUF6364)
MFFINLYVYIHIMDAKLTLKLDKNVIERAKVYAAQQQNSLSQLVENYFKAITSVERKEDTKTSSFIKSLVLKNSEIDSDFDYKKDRQDYLVEKYNSL